MIVLMAMVVFVLVNMCRFILHGAGKQILRFDMGDVVLRKFLERVNALFST